MRWYLAPLPPPLVQKRNVYASLGIIEDQEFVATYGNYPHGSPFPLGSSESEASKSIDDALIVAYTCFSFDLLGMLGGFTLFFPRVNLFQTVVHFVGGVYVSWFIGEGRYKSERPPRAH